METEPIINQYLRQMLELGGSDLHLSIDCPPKARVHGDIIALTDEKVADPLDLTVKKDKEQKEEA